MTTPDLSPGSPERAAGGTAPDPGVVLDRLWERLPDHYRAADAQQGDRVLLTDHPMYRWLAGICSQLSQVDTLINRLDVEVDGRSDLTDPASADIAWLEWLAQLVGVTLDPALSDAEKRDAVLFGSSGWRAGTKVAVGDAAKTVLTGEKRVRIYDHTVFAPGDGGVWDVLVMTRPSETPDVALVLDTIVRKRAKPAGVVLHHRAYEASWDTVEAVLPSWDAIEAAGSWTSVQEAGL